MTESQGNEERGSPALAELTRLGRDAPRPPSSSELAEGLDTLRRQMGGRARRAALLRRSALGATAAACLVVALKVWSGSAVRSPPSEQPVNVARVEGGQLLEGGYLSQSGGAGVSLSFNEGSRFELTSGTRARLREVSGKRVQLAIEHGEASLQVTPSRDRHWLVEAGPFLVTVKGTAFTVSWDQPSERFELTLRHGRVVVSGPIVDGAIALRAGQRLVVSLPRAETLITDVPPTRRAGQAPVTAPPAVDAVPVSRPQAARAPTGRPTPIPASPSARGPRQWASELARGHWDEILADADGIGIDAALAEASSEELFALADAARYRRRAELARAALLAQRRRFPRSPRALDAVFFLGRAEELREQGGARAIAWYDQYLAGAPGGVYAAEALGRKMILTNEQGSADKARAIAREYLLRFPGGSYAGSARALQRLP